METTLVAVAITSALAWSAIYAAIMCLAAPLVIGANVKILRTYLAALVGVVAPALIIATPISPLMLSLSQSEWRGWVQLAMVVLVFVVGVAANALLLRRGNGERLSLLEAARIQLSAQIGGIALRALLFLLGVFPVFSWF